MKINIIGVPLFYGCDKPGVEKGPDVLRKNGLIDVFTKKHEVCDLGNVKVNEVSSEDKYKFNNTMKYLDEIININNELADKVNNSFNNGALPLIIGGDHALGMGSLAGCGKYFGQDLAVIWVDAHGDINTPETSPSGNVHGMPLAASMRVGYDALTNIYYNGCKVNPKNVYIIGARDLDKGEVELIENKHLNVWTMNDIKEKGLEECLNELISKLNSSNIKNVHLSFDIDSIDPTFIPGTGTPVIDGLTMEGGKKIIKDLLNTNLIRSIDFVEFNPSLDKGDVTLNNCLSLLEEISNNL